MHSRWFNAAVVMLWLATMSWLVKAKVLPPLLIGEPPNYASIIAAQRADPPVGWRMMYNSRPLGWALTTSKLQSTGLTELYGRVHFDSLPLEDLMPGWLRALSRLIEHPIDRLQLDARSLLSIDPLGRLTRFDSAVHIDPLNEAICVRGTIEGKQLQLVVRSGGASFSTEAYLPSDALLSDALSPQTRLPGLRAGQTWTVPVYSPLWPAKNPLEIVQAVVVGKEPLLWQGAMEDAWLVEYRNDQGSIGGKAQTPRGKLWVRTDGVVLKQQVTLFDSIITFVRLPDAEAQALAEIAGDQWWIAEEYPQENQRLTSSDTPADQTGSALDDESVEPCWYGEPTDAPGWQSGWPAVQDAVFPEKPSAGPAP